MPVGEHGGEGKGVGLLQGGSRVCLTLFLLLTEMDDEDCERRRMECLDEMSNLEKQFTDLKDQ